MITCARCDSEVEADYSMGAEVGGKDWKDVCRECYDEIVDTCQICGEDTMPSAVSEFILVKAELARTAGRPPGIYRVIDRPFMLCSMLGGGSLTNYMVRFVDKLPKFDNTFDISGHICKSCAKPYAETDARVYKCPRSRPGYYRSASAFWMFHKHGWRIQNCYTRAVILSNPDMLRDLECDVADRDENGHICGANAAPWEALRDTYGLPPLPTYHEWPLVMHNGVTVYRTDEGSGYFGELALRPEPRYRNQYARTPLLFHYTELPTYKPRFYKSYTGETRSVHDYYKDKDWAVETVVAAIEAGALTPQGVAKIAALDPAQEACL